MATEFRPSDLDAAAFVSLRGIRLLDVEHVGPRATFVFEGRGANVVQEYYSGCSVVAMEYAAQLRAMKRAIFTVGARGGRR